MPSRRRSCVIASRWDHPQGRWGVAMSHFILRVAFCIGVVAHSHGADAYELIPPYAQGELDKGRRAGPFRLICGEQGWLIAPTVGPPFFSVGVDVVAPGPDESRFDKANPAYAWWRFHRTKDQWAASTLRRLK